MKLATASIGFSAPLTESPMFEYACHEGNYDIANTLRGTREEEKVAARGQ